MVPRGVPDPTARLTVPIEDVSALVTRWQRARSPAEQVRVVAAGARVLRSLSHDDRRVLAQALGERGATDAAARLSSFRSDQLTRGQMTDLATALSGVDRRQLEATAATLADPAERERLLREADGAVHGSTPQDPAPPPPPAPTGTPAPLPPPPGTPGPDAFSETDGIGDDELVVDGAEGDGETVEGPEEAVDDRPDEFAAEVEAMAAEIEAAERGSDDERADREQATDPVAPAPEDDLPPTSGVDDVLSAIEAAGSVRAQLTEATALAGRPLSGDQLVAVLRQLPDGWQRRTAARRVLSAGGVDGLDAGDLLDVFDRDSDRLTIAQLLVAHGLAHVGAVTDHLDRPSADRVLRRARRRP